MHHVGLRIPLRAGVLAGFLPRWLLDALVWNGTEAVFIFFVISGFLITSNTLARWGRLGAIHVRAFYARRGARILPCLLILVALLSLLHLAGARDFVISRASQSLLWPVVRAFKATGGGLRWGFLWYVPALALSWLLGWLVSVTLSLPGERALRRRLLPVP
jgi:peptidoglycan/LPS O-acetylase OafA/YrhL